MKRALIGVALVWAACAAPALASFPGENGEIAIQSARTPGNFDISAIGLDGSVRTILRAPVGLQVSSPAWSPDGEWIVYVRYELYQGGYDTNLFLANRDGLGERRLTSTGYMEESPSWSPDGRHIVYMADPTMHCPPRDAYCEAELRILDVETLDSTVLTDHGYQPAWSPRGDTIAFTRNTQCAGCSADIYVISPDGTGLTNLTAGSPGTSSYDYDVSSTWSPDGDQLAYASWPQIYKMNADGSDKTQLTFTQDPAGFIVARDPAWSPDGERITFIWRHAGQCGVWECGDEVFHMATDGSDLTRLTHDNVRDDQPDWAPIPNRPPDCSELMPSRRELWPPNRRFVRVTVTGAHDPDGDPLTVEVTGVTQDEPVTAMRGWTTPDARLEGNGSVRLRAERDPRGNGRVYRVAVHVSDTTGASCGGSVTVEVRRHMHKPAIDSAPPSFNSLGE